MDVLVGLIEHLKVLHDNYDPTHAVKLLAWLDAGGLKGAEQSLIEFLDDLSAQAIIKKQIANELNSLQYIEGPVTLTEHVSTKYNMRIYNFGDHHVHEGKCPPNVRRLPIDRFITLLVAMKDPEFVDLYLETHYRDRTMKFIDPPESNSYYLGNVIKAFWTCLQRRKGVCHLPNLRAHYVDIRRTTLTYIDRLSTVRDKLEEFSEAEKPIAGFARYIEDSRKLFKVPIATYVQQSKIPKQLANISDEKTRLIIETHFMEKLQQSQVTETDLKELLTLADEETTQHLRLNTLKSELNTLKSELKTYESNYHRSLQRVEFLKSEQALKELGPEQREVELTKESNTTLKEGNQMVNLMKQVNEFDIGVIKSLFFQRLHLFSRKLLKFGTYLMDFYLVARLFRNFEEKEGTYQARNVILYTGDAHAEDYREVFDKLGLTVPHRTVSEGKDNTYQCINVKGFAPWFVPISTTLPLQVRPFSTLRPLKIDEVLSTPAARSKSERVLFKRKSRPSALKSK